MLKCHETDNGTAQKIPELALKIKISNPSPSAHFTPCSVLNKVERHLESSIQIGDLRPRKGPNDIRKIGLTKAHKVVTHDPA